MKPIAPVASSLFALMVLAGCASSGVTARQSNVAGQEIARPGRVIVHSFAASPDEIAADSAVAGRYDKRTAPQTAEGLRPLGSAEVEAGGGKMPGMLVPVAGGAAAGTVVTSAAISAGLSAGREVGSESIEGAADRTAEELAKLLEEGFRKRGWIQ